MPRGEVVDPVAERTRNPDEQGDERPRKAQVPGDPQGGRGLREHAPVVEEHEGVRTRGRVRSAGQDGRRRVRLQGQELEPGRAIAFGDEPDRVPAQPTRAVKEDGQRSHTEESL